MTSRTRGKGFRDVPRAVKSQLCSVLSWELASQRNSRSACRKAHVALQAGKQLHFNES